VNKRVPKERANERVWELLYLRSQDKITPERFVDLVNIVEFVEPRWPENVLDEGYIPGTFDIIRQGLTDGVISEDEYGAIALEVKLYETKGD